MEYKLCESLGLRQKVALFHALGVHIFIGVCVKKHKLRTSSPIPAQDSQRLNGKILKGSF